MSDQSLNDREFTLEIDHGHDAYSNEELLEQAQFNAQALLLASVAATENTRLEAWTKGVAEVYLRGWDQEQPWEPPAILDALLTNYRSFGAHVIDVDLQADPPTATIAELPDLELAESLGVLETDADAIFQIGGHIVESLGRSLQWSRDVELGDVTLSVS